MEMGIGKNIQTRPSNIAILLILGTPRSHQWSSKICVQLCRWQLQSQLYATHSVSSTRLLMAVKLSRYFHVIILPGPDKDRYRVYMQFSRHFSKLKQY